MSKLKVSSSELDFDRPNIEDYLPSGSIQEPHGKLRLRDLLDISPTLTEAAGAVVDYIRKDNLSVLIMGFLYFLESCSETISLADLWLEWKYGWVMLSILALQKHNRVLFLMHDRTLSQDASSLILQSHGTGTYTCSLCGAWEFCQIWVTFPTERGLVELICSFFVASWTGVVKYHGPRPSIRPKQVFVANHTSMIDFIVLEQMTAFAVIMQKHPGWVGLLQSTILESLGCIWFNRSEAKDREIVARKLREHVHGADNNPLLIFPEGTCVNNHYTVMFKKGAFELGCTVCPVAIKYNKIFVDAFWNSRKVRDIISMRAGLRKVPWDGYLKYSRPSPKHRERNRFATKLCRISPPPPGRDIDSIIPFVVYCLLWLDREVV
ncbi:glycerol-3-phosphate acyltransferase [Striga asiatica]|uniref:Glycerol-3-phosphate acyltransferase n=1 Tax=Striga asiatica TaxID=4170 RepID=A0A5A7RD22_STRAF|nr:glycerol-3-phosphate acyltransferase [Striga asiatica]